ncbi:type I polyketide synthase [Streptomyces sp. NPDC003691]
MNDAAAGVAVIGLSCRFPGARDPGEFWRLLRDGGSTVGRFPPHRTAAPDPAAHPDAAALYTGSFFDSVDGFDAGFFGVTPDEAAAMDPVQRLGLELAWEAVEDARLPPAALAGRPVDVLVGAASSGYDALRARSGSDRDDHYAALGSSGALIANRISALFDVRGMSFCADSGQSSSLVSLALACERIRSGAVTTAIAGGVNLIADPETGSGLANLGALSAAGRCFAFDDRADGFVRGEGGAFVLLKALDAALADGDRIRAVVRGWSAGNGGASARMPDPSPAAQAATVLSALRHAGVPFDGVDYVEAHGTGTRLGDPAELTGLRRVSRDTGRRRPLVIGSVKTNIGHLEPAAGITGLVKTVLCLEHGRLVPSLNFRTPTAAVPDFETDFEVPRTVRPWPVTRGRPRRAGVSSFGMGGTNAHVILEEAPRTPVEPPDPGPVAVAGILPWVLSARSEPALREQARRLAGFLAADPPPAAADAAYSLVATRPSFEHRAVLLGDGRGRPAAGLAALAAGEGAARVIRGVAGDTAGPVVFVFPGQGAQWAGMGRRLHAESEVFAAGIDACERALAPWVDWSLTAVLTGGAPAALLERVDVVQPVLFSVMVALARVWRALGVVPDAVVGHSQGEIAAACVSGALTLEDAARIVALRSRALTGLTGRGGGMSAVAATPEWAVGRLARWAGRLSLAAVNGPESVVISGNGTALDEFAAAAAADGVRVRRVKVDYASHSRHVESLRERLLRDLAGVSPAETAVEFHSTVTGGPLEPGALTGPYWYDNLRSTVRFAEVTGRLMRERGGVYVEVGPHPVLTAAMEETADALGVAPPVVGTLHKDDGGADRILAALAELYVQGVPVDWPGLFAEPRPRRIALPAYPFQRRGYWLTAPGGSAPPARPVSAAPGSGTPPPGTPHGALRTVCAEAAAVLAERGTAVTGAELMARSAETFRDLGFDSAMAVRLRNRLRAAAGVGLPATVAFSHPTPQALGAHVAALLAPAAPERGEAPGAPEDPDGRGAADPGDEELYELIDRGYL